MRDKLTGLLREERNVCKRTHEAYDHFHASAIQCIEKLRSERAQEAEHFKSEINEVRQAEACALSQYADALGRTELDHSNTTWEAHLALDACENASYEYEQESERWWDSAEYYETECEQNGVNYQALKKKHQKEMDDLVDRSQDLFSTHL